MIEVSIPYWFYPVLAWTIAWKAVAAWKAARKGHLVWFVAFFVVNTVGILPIMYIFFFQNMKLEKKSKKKKSKKKKKAPGLFK